MRIIAILKMAAPHMWLAGLCEIKKFTSLRFTMSVHTRTRHTKRVSAPKKKTKARAKPKERLIPWRKAFKDEIEAYGEGGLMLRGSRHKAEMTQNDLAEALGISQHHISEMENGKRPIGKLMARRLAEIFKCNYRKFL
jgi:DNA-binding XRE family transcriptional regulator